MERTDADVEDTIAKILILIHALYLCQLIDAHSFGLFGLFKTTKKNERRHCRNHSVTGNQVNAVAVRLLVDCELFRVVMGVFDSVVNGLTREDCLNEELCDVTKYSLSLRTQEKNPQNSYIPRNIYCSIAVSIAQDVLICHNANSTTKT